MDRVTISNSRIRAQVITSHQGTTFALTKPFALASSSSFSQVSLSFLSAMAELVLVLVPVVAHPPVPVLDLLAAGTEPGQVGVELVRRCPLSLQHPEVYSLE